MITILARLAAPLMAIGVLAVVSLPAGPAAASSVAPVAPVAATSRARDAGTISGSVVSVDYQRGTMVVDAAGRGRTTIDVPPSTSIQGKDDEFLTIADVKAGARVEIYASENAGRLVAQIIKLL